MQCILLLRNVIFKFMKQSLASEIDLYDYNFRVNESITRVVSHSKNGRKNNCLMQECCIRFIMFYKFSRIRRKVSQQSSQL